MSKFIRIFVVLCFTLTLASLANAQATRTWVSGVGDDVNPCSRTAPCKTFAGAISKTFINGEIDCLDPGGFGTLTATKSITIDGSGTFGSILASGTNGVNINIAVSANDPLRTVTLRGLSINGAGASGAVGTRTGIQGINVTTNGAAAVFIEDCVVFKFSQNGYNQSNTTSTTNVFIKNSVFRDNGNDGVFARATAGLFVRVSAEHSHFTGNVQNGMEGGANARFSADHCALSGNGNAGALSRSLTAGLNSVVNVSESQVANNLLHGVQAGGGGALATSFLVIDGNDISGSGTDGINIGANGEIDTFGNNQIFGNNINGCPGCTAVPQPNT
jgi:hypothetical protein